ncbi:ion transporter [Alphaproteobacteria bacterium GH1-50]|uniref:Ion transporter n=1 Tax=Kangsaoukella pontilimi TaxID=2691042 RepID=A0A7C9N1A3_9RHOB|nr:ion transporter [Kangsaoukella pontilimi]MXQ08618.1 ion transporter [Kangsaoukella pontilimi]
MRQMLARLISHRLFEPVIMVLIVINAITLALETSPSAMAAAGPLLIALDRAILAIFVLELAARLIVDFRGFWRDPWRIFDFAVVAIALLPATGPLSVLRAFRILRVLRLVSTVPAMRRVVAGLLSALPGMGSIVALLGLIFFVFSVISTKLFASAFPDWFGTIGASSYTLFQVMTLESWSMGIVRPVMEVYPWAWVLFVPFIILTAFAVLNLFIGVIVDAMQSEHADAAHDEREAMKTESAEILSEVRALRAELAALKAER